MTKCTESEFLPMHIMKVTLFEGFCCVIVDNHSVNPFAPSILAWYHTVT